MTDLERDALLLNIDTKIDEMRDTDMKIKTVLFDSNGNKGLCSKVEAVCDEVEKHKSHINKLWLAIAVITGGTGTTVGIAKLVQVLSGG